MTGQHTHAARVQPSDMPGQANLEKTWAPSSTRSIMNSVCVSGGSNDGLSRTFNDSRQPEARRFFRDPSTTLSPLSPAG
jgi:hypothetical protein